MQKPDAPALQPLLSRPTGVIYLPAGIHVLSRPLTLPLGAKDLQIKGVPGKTKLRAALGFQGPALLVCRGTHNVHLSGIAFEGNREQISETSGLPPSEVRFADFQQRNGILAIDAEQLTLEDLSFRQISGFSILVSHSRDVRIRNILVEDSGSKNANHRNNTTGGILIEDGTSNFRVEDSTLRRVRGNGIWTHSRYRRARNKEGQIAGNRFEQIGRDAVQAGHATRITVENNSGTRIGFPVEDVDVEGGGTPVAIDTAGNVDLSIYRGNSFTEVNGKCIDLDGFHHGEVVQNTCRNSGPVSDYVFGHFGVVFNNTNPDMQSEAVTVTGNVIDGTRYGGIYVIGSNHVITKNQLLRLNMAGCNPARRTLPECSYWKEDPALLEAGIYLGNHAERSAVTRSNQIRQNRIEGFGMQRSCIAAAPGVDLKQQQISGNICRNSESNH